MTKAQAKKLVLQVAASTISNDVRDLAAGWLCEDDDGNDRPEKDVERIKDAAEDFVAEMLRRAATPAR